MRKVLVMLLLLLSVVAEATAQTDRPDIIQFSAEAQAVSRERLADGSQRVRVSWDVANRPESADLIFEQILPGYTTVNVELPREITWVNSSGTGLIAPDDPGESANGILLMLRVVDRSSRRMLDFRLLYLPVVSETEYAALEAPGILSGSGGTLDSIATPTAVIYNPPTSITLVTATPTPVQQSVQGGTMLEIRDFHIYNEAPSLEDNVLLVWEVYNADEMWIQGIRFNPSEWPEGASVSGSYNGGARLPVRTLVSEPGQHTITLAAHNTATGQTASKPFTINVHEGELPSQPAAKIISFEINPQYVTLSGTITLTWEATDADLLSVSSWFVENPNGAIKTVTLQPSPTGSVTIPVADLVNEPGNYWIGLDAQSTRPGWTGSGYSQSINVGP